MLGVEALCSDVLLSESERDREKEGEKKRERARGRRERGREDFFRRGRWERTEGRRDLADDVDRK